MTDPTQWSPAGVAPKPPGVWQDTTTRLVPGSDAIVADESGDGSESSRTRAGRTDGNDHDGEPKASRGCAWRVPCDGDGDPADHTARGNEALTELMIDDTDSAVCPRCIDIESVTEADRGSAPGETASRVNEGAERADRVGGAGSSSRGRNR